MSKYHPLDVRYKGPSTAYRGSAFHKRQPGVPDPPDPAIPPIPSPWGAGRSAPSRPPGPRSQIRFRPWTILTRSFAVGRRILRIGAYVQVVLALLIYLLLTDQFPSIDLSGQMISITGD